MRPLLGKSPSPKPRLALGIALNAARLLLTAARPLDPRPFLAVDGGAGDAVEQHIGQRAECPAGLAHSIFMMGRADFDNAPIAGLGMQPLRLVDGVAEPNGALGPGANRFALGACHRA